MRTDIGLQSRLKTLLQPVARYSNQSAWASPDLYAASVDRFFNSHDMKTWSLKRASRGQLPDAVIKDMARKFDPQKMQAKPIPFYEVPRSGRDPRLICHFPLKQAASLLLGQKLLEASFTPHESIYCWTKRGKDLLVTKLADALGSIEDPHLVIADVVDCFPSVRIDNIRQRKVLPDPYFDAAIDGRNMRFWRKGLHRNRKDHNHMRANRGLPRSIVMGAECTGLSGLLLGAATSNALLAIIFDDLHSVMPDGIILFVYCDNIVVVCRSQDQCSQVQEILLAYYSQHLAGPFTLTFSHIGDARESFETCGYRFDWSSSEGWIVRHSKKNLLGAIQRLIETHDPAENEGLTATDALVCLLQGFPALDDEAIGQLTEIISEQTWL